MSIEKLYINTHFITKNKQTPTRVDLLAKHRGYFYNLEGGMQGGQGTTEFNEKGITVSFGTPTEVGANAYGGCFEFNDIYRSYPVFIRSSDVTTKDPIQGAPDGPPRDKAGRTLGMWTKLLFGTGPDGTDPLIPVMLAGGTELIPFGQDGLLTKAFFNTRYYDYSFKQMIPTSPQMAVQGANGMGSVLNQFSPSHQLASSYSYYVEEYEDYVANTEIGEISLPYIYNFIDEIHNSNLDNDNPFSSLEQTKTFFWNDPKCNMFLGGSNTPVILFNDAGTTTPFALNLPSNGFGLDPQVVDFAPSISEPFRDIAQFQQKMLGAKLDNIDTLYEDQYNKNITPRLQEYFKKWALEASLPSVPVVKEGEESLEAQFGGSEEYLYTIERAKNIRKLLEYKYKNIFFRQSELMDYNNTKDLFPMATRISVDNIPNINSDDGWLRVSTANNSFRGLLKSWKFYENVFEKLADTTAQPFLKAFIGGKAQTEEGYDSEYLYPRTLDEEDDSFDGRTKFTTVKINNETGKTTAELPSNVKMLDFKEFIKELKDPDGDYVYKEEGGFDVGAENHKSIRYAAVGINKELGQGDGYVEGSIQDPVEQGGGPAPLLADYFSQDIYDFVHTIFDVSVMDVQWPDGSGGAGSGTEDPHMFFKAYSEILGIRVSKHEIDETTGEPKAQPIQNIYFPNSSLVDYNAQTEQKMFPTWEIDYLDSHVKYGKKYHYKTHLITAVIGKRYFYRNLTAPHLDTDGEKQYFQATLEMVVEPSVVIMEVPYSTIGTVPVISPPPLPPSPEFIPSQETPGVVKILLLNDNTSAYRFPMPVEDYDKEFYSSVISSQNLTGDHAGKIFFASDEDVSGYRIYRLDEKPLALTDFADSYTFVSTDLDATHYNDVLSLNTKYYYMFRTIDGHDGPSNPSHIYELELVSLADGVTNIAVYPVIKVYTISEFFKPEAFPNKRTFRRYIHIKPSKNQSQISNLEKLLSDDAYKLSIEDPDTGEITKEFSDEWNKYSENYTIKKTEFPTFGAASPEGRYIIGSKIGHGVSTLKNRKIKIRLTSKQTGRKMDLNLNFKHTHFPYDPKHPDKNENVPDQEDI